MNQIVNVEDEWSQITGDERFTPEGVSLKPDAMIRYPNEVVEEPAKDDMLQQVRMIEVFRAANMGTLVVNGETIGQTDYLREEWERVMTERELRDDHGNPDHEQGNRVNEWEEFFASKDTGQAQKYNGDRR